MTLAYFDCFSGAAGDMILGALIDAGADLNALQQQVSALGIAGCELSAEKVVKQGISATQATVHDRAGDRQPHRHLSDVQKIIESAPLSHSVKQKALSVFQRLAQAEATVHGTSIEKVHFHEVGAVDAIADICGTMIALESLNVDRVLCSPIPTGSGTVTCDHGILPIPAPATANLLTGVPLADCDEPGELTTPTGAAIFTTLAESFGPPPAMTITSIGYGAGTRDNPNRPNVLRVLLGKSADPAGQDAITVLETNLDDASPQILGHCVEALLAAGALDAYTTPIYMKKSRPGVMLTALANPHQADELERLIFAETPTLGIRRYTAARAVARRRIDKVRTRFGEIGVKVGHSPGGARTASPEYQDCRVAARQHQVPLRVVQGEAVRAWWSQVSPDAETKS
ncbi:MAG: nickel pincer cofactor biosynthesis protein LarC [Phycisphaerae bacterium]